MKKIAQWLLFFGALVFFLFLFGEQWHVISARSWSINLPLAGASLGLLFVLFFVDAGGWHVILKSLGCSIRLKYSVRVWLLASLARYLPGVVWVYVSRVSLASDHGIKPSDCVRSMLLETLFLALTSLFVSLPVIIKVFNPQLDLELVLAAVLLILVCVLLRAKLAMAWEFLKSRIGSLQYFKLPSFGYFVIIGVYYCFFWIFLSLSFLLFSFSIFPDLALDLHNGAYVGLAFPLSFFFGFVVVFTPGGLGVREMSLYGLLIQFMEPSQALVLSSASRLWLMAGEGLAMLVAYRMKCGKTFA
jgi:uncharacterized membrane protein YbhN (UPF0104 family)